MNKTNDNQYITIEPKIAHIGLGAFHRAHQALYTHELLDKKLSDWTICSINIFGSLQLIEDLEAQKYRYTVLERGATSDKVKVSESIVQSLHSKKDGTEAVLEKLADQNIAIVSLTVTEKGYCIEPSTGSLDTENALIKQDLTSPSQPQTAIGYIVEALRLRQQRGIPAFTVMSCDNIQSNGDVAKTAVLSYAKLLDQDLYQWISTNVSFPNTMVDRIVPAMTDETLQQLEVDLGYKDPCAIVCEPFRQWVIEDNFVNGRPNWNDIGADFVEDVVPFEEMKLRMLNGSHSFLAYMGYLSGYQTISDAIHDESFKNVILDFMLNEQAPTLNLPQGVDVNKYAHSLIERFSNKNLRHLTSQIATDGSQKLAPRFCESLKFNRQNGLQSKWLELGIAAWMSYVVGKDDAGNAIEVNDPLAETFKQIREQYSQQKLDKSATVLSLLKLNSIFDQDFLNDQTLVENITNNFISIQNNGAKQTLYSQTAHS